jgi:hypothetical protein
MRSCPLCLTAPMYWCWDLFLNVFIMHPTTLRSRIDMCTFPFTDDDSTNESNPKYYEEKTNFTLKKTNFRNFGICVPSKQKIFWVLYYVQFDFIIFFQKYVNLYLLCVCETKMLIAVEITRKLQNIRLLIETGEFFFLLNHFPLK